MVDGYRPGLTPRNLVKNLSQGPIIHRPHPHQKQQRLLEFRAPSNPPGGRSSGTRLPPGPERTVARSVRGRQPFKYETMGHHTVVVCLETRRSAHGGPAMLQTPQRGAGGGSIRENLHRALGHQGVHPGRHSRKRFSPTTFPVKGRQADVIRRGNRGRRVHQTYPQGE